MLAHCAAQVEQLRLDAAAEARLRQRTLLLHDEPITGTPVRHEAWARASAATSLCDVVRVALSRALRHTPRLSYLRHTAQRSRARPARWLLEALQPKGPEGVRRFKRTSARPSPLRTRHGGAARTSRRSSARTAARTTSASARATRSVGPVGLSNAVQVWLRVDLRTAAVARAARRQSQRLTHTEMLRKRIDESSRRRLWADVLGAVYCAAVGGGGRMEPHRPADTAGGDPAAHAAAAVCDEHEHYRVSSASLNHRHRT